MTGSTYYGDALTAAVNNGQVSQATIDDHVRRILTSMFASGLFDSPPTGTMGSTVTSDAHQATGHKPMMVSNARLHSLPAGYRLDLRARRVLPREVTVSPRIAQLAQGRVAKMVRQAAAGMHQCMEIHRHVRSGSAEGAPVRPTRGADALVRPPRGPRADGRSAR